MLRGLPPVPTGEVPATLPDPDPVGWLAVATRHAGPGARRVLRAAGHGVGRDPGRRGRHRGRRRRAVREGHRPRADRQRGRRRGHRGRRAADRAVPGAAHPGDVRAAGAPAPAGDRRRPGDFDAGVARRPRRRRRHAAGVPSATAGASGRCSAARCSPRPSAATTRKRRSRSPRGPARWRARSPGALVGARLGVPGLPAAGSPRCPTSACSTTSRATSSGTSTATASRRRPRNTPRWERRYPSGRFTPKPKGPDLRSRLRGSLLAGAIGDALGAKTEFDSIDRIREIAGPAGITDFIPAYGGVGRITDDTQMTLFTLEALIRAHAQRAADRLRGRRALAADGLPALAAHPGRRRGTGRADRSRRPRRRTAGWSPTRSCSAGAHRA